MLMQYVKDKRGNRIGVIVALDRKNIGWSKVHKPLDKFDRELGLSIASGRAAKGSTTPAPQMILDVIFSEEFQDRLIRYFQDKK